MALRAIVKAAAFGANPEGMRYSTPHLVDSSNNVLDARDGAGVLLADGLRLFCEPDGSGHGGGFSETGVIDLSQGKEAPFAGDCKLCGQVIAQSMRPGTVVPRAIAPFDPSDGRLYRVFRKFSGYRGRIRAVFTWNACTAGATGTAPAPLAVDFDMFLVDEANHRVVYSSQSVDDNTEGFDFVVDSAGDYALYVGWPKGAAACGGGVTEGYALAGITWP